MEIPATAPRRERQLASYSMFSAFRNCRRKAELRYVENLVPIERDRNLRFGSEIHKYLEAWHLRRDLDEVLGLVDATYHAREGDPELKRDWHVARAMMAAYAERYSPEEFEVVSLEKEFRGPIVNPRTGAASRSFDLGGRIDGIVKVGDDYFLLENKTASLVDSAYLERLWLDLQLSIYTAYARECLGVPIKGAIYNILCKPRLQQSTGETEEEFEARRSELIAKSKTGKSSAKRRLPESDEEFAARLAEKFREPEMFHRERLFISETDVERTREELWELAGAFREARRRGVFYPNTDCCFRNHRPCEYLPLCRSGSSPVVRENLYEQRRPHEELSNGPPEEAPVF